MIKLVVADLWTHARVWAGVLLVCIATGGIGAVSVGLIETGNHYGGSIQYDLAGASTILILFSTAAALIVLSSATGLAVALQQWTYAVWQLAGLAPGLVTAVVLAQLAVTGAVGAVTGWAVVKVFSAPIFGWLWRPLNFAEDISVHLSGTGLAGIAAAQCLVVLAGGFGGARRAGRVSPLEALRTAETAMIPFGWVRGLVLLVLAGAAAAFSVSLMQAEFETIAGSALLLIPLFAAVLAAAGTVVFQPVLKGWTSLVPRRWSASWYLACNSAGYRLGQSTASITPLMMATALSGGIFTTAATLSSAVGEKRELSVGVVILMIGGPLLLAGVGAMATVFMSGYAREREFALIRAAGSTAALVVLAAIWEALIYTVTAAVLGTAAILAGAVVLALALGLDAPVLSLASVAVVGGCGFVLLLAATLVPTFLCVRAEVPSQLAAE